MKQSIDQKLSHVRIEFVNDRFVTAHLITQ